MKDYPLITNWLIFSSLILVLGVSFLFPCSWLTFFHWLSIGLILGLFATLIDKAEKDKP